MSAYPPVPIVTNLPLALTYLDHILVSAILDILEMDISVKVFVDSIEFLFGF